ncbi:MAG: GTPase HflX [Anaerovoracaceae bacterium]|jgi:GTP-binding protein HflX|nr:GTPase HflX [Anaerovoracaceae bacterium]
MAGLIETRDQEEGRAILVGVQGRESISYFMDELEGLAEAAGIVVLGNMIQNLERPDRVTYIGKGKVLELSEMAANMEANMVIINDELSGIQMRNLENALDLRVIDRTVLVLDIFASRATSSEGKLQVELAQLQYRLPRLTGFGTSLSRQGAGGGRGLGIGTRGPGEKKLETDRRHITKRIDDIKAEMQKAAQTRTVQRGKREKSSLPIVALVGYTNSGKSAIMNRFLALSDKEEKQVEEKDMLFASLETRQRNVKIKDNRNFLLVDTVGFVSKLPHHLVKAFKATLEEVVLADLILLVVDAAYDNQDFHLEVTNKVLKELGAGNNEKIVVFNKIDLVENPNFINNGNSLGVSAKYGTNFDQLMKAIEAKIFQNYKHVILLIPYDRGDLTSYLVEKTEILSTSYEEEGTRIEANLSNADYLRFEKYLEDK